MRTSREEILAGVKGPRRDIVRGERGGRIARRGGLAGDLLEGVRLASAAIDSGQAARVLSRLQERFPK